MQGGKCVVDVALRRARHVQRELYADYQHCYKDGVGIIIHPLSAMRWNTLLGQVIETLEAAVDTPRTPNSGRRAMEKTYQDLRADITIEATLRGIERRLKRNIAVIFRGRFSEDLMLTGVNVVRVRRWPEQHHKVGLGSFGFDRPLAWGKNASEEPMPCNRPWLDG